MKKEPTLRDNCGTRNGYQVHGYHGEKACQPCIDANSARYRRWYENNSHNERERWKKNYQDPEYKKRKQVASSNRRVAILGGETEDYSIADILHVYGIACHICNETIDLTAPRRVGDEGWERGLHLDHVISVKKGGPDTVENVKPSHAICNIKKSGR